MGSINSISDISALADFDHQEFFIIEDFNDRYLKGFKYFIKQNLARDK